MEIVVKNVKHFLKKTTITDCCIKCQNNDRRIPYNLLQSTVEKHGLTLITKPDDYISNKHKLELLCQCGKPFSSRLALIKRGKKCQTCTYNQQVKTSESTTMRLYGVKNVTFLPEILSKINQSSYCTKNYTMPSGKIVEVQGYEPQALDYLIATGFVEDDIVVDENRPTISYEFYEHQKKYYPDIYIKSTNTGIEVKCYYTLLKDLEMNYRKWQSTLALGFKFRLILFNDKAELMKDITYEFLDDFDDNLHHHLE